MIETDYLKESSTLISDLKQIPSLKPFTEDDLKRLIKRSKIRKYLDGEEIVKEGIVDTYIYFLIYGTVRVTKGGKELAVLQRRGDLFGEMAVLDRTARSASVYAVGKAVCLATDTEYIDKLTGEDKITFCYVLYRVFSEVLAERLRVTSEKLIETMGIEDDVW